MFILFCAFTFAFAINQYYILLHWNITFFVQVLAPLPDFIAKNMGYYCNGSND